MKKPKLLFRIDRNNAGHVYINGKWIKGVYEINIHGEPWNYSILLAKYKLNKNGVYYTVGNDIASEIKEYHIRGNKRISHKRENV